jgi:hypothetical protein
MRQILPFILCGGVGARLWPLSRGYASVSTMTPLNRAVGSLWTSVFPIKYCAALSFAVTLVVAMGSSGWLQQLALMDTHARMVVSHAASARC